MRVCDKSEPDENKVRGQLNIPFAKSLPNGFRQLCVPGCFCHNVGQCPAKQYHRLPVPDRCPSSIFSLFASARQQSYGNASSTKKTAPMTSLIELQQLTKDYPGHRALHEVDLTVESGITGLLGPNGAGKSTLIKVLLGLVKVTQGTGHVLGTPLGTQAALIRSKIGYMPEDDCYLHGLSGIETVQFAARLSRMPSTEALRRGHEILDFCGMGQERYRNVETFSTGMRQKLRFALALVHDPQLLILDEPTSGLDPQERDAMLNRIRILARQFGKSIILCTHILPDVQTVCDFVTILANGRIRLAGNLEMLCAVRDPSLTVQVTGDCDQLLGLLRDAAVRVETMTVRQFRVYGDAKSLNSVLWGAADRSGTTIRSIQPSRNSLEQIFLDAVKEVHHAHS